MADPNPNPSLLNQQTIFQGAYDEITQRLRTDASFDGSFTGELQVDFSAADGDTVGLQSSDGSQTATYTDDSGKTGLDVNVLNALETQPSGLRTGLKTTSQVVTDVASPLPLVPLMNRNTLSIRVIGTSNVYFGGADVTPANGYTKFQFEEIIADVTDNSAVAIWAVCDSGATSEVRILEIA